MVGGSTQTPWLVCASLVLLCAATFEGLRQADFADLDDLGGIQANTHLEVHSTGEALHNAWTRTLLSNWIPLTIHSHQLDRWLYDERAPGHHATSWLLHVASSLLLFRALLAMTGALWRSALVAAVFAVHPLHVETVAWVSERKGVLSGLFFNLTLWTYARYAAVPTARRYAAVLGSMALALLSKPTTVTLPCVLLLLDAWPLRRLTRHAVIEKIPLLALALCQAAVTFLVQRAEGAMRFGETIAFHDRLANAIAAYGTYLTQSVWPAGLAGFYGFPVHGVSAQCVALGAAALVGTGAIALWLRRTRPYLLVGWLWFAGMLVPTLGLVQVGEQSHADRYMYLPLVGLSIAVCWGIADLAQRLGAARAIGFAGGLVVVVLAAVSHRQVDHWRNGEAFWLRVLEVDPDYYGAQIGLGSIHARRLELDEAEARYAAAYASDPERAAPTLVLYHRTKASHLRKRGDEQGALESQHLAVHYGPDDASAWLELGLALGRAGQRDEARRVLERARALAPRNLQVLLALASDAQRAGRFAEAIALHREILALFPSHAENANDLAWLLATAPEASDRDPVEALRLARALVESTEDPSPNKLDTLAAAQAASGQFEAALETADRALAQVREAKDASLAASIAARRSLYADRVPYRETGAR